MEEEKKFSCSGNEGEFGGFAIGDETAVKEFELGMVLAGAQGAKVKDATHLWSAAVDMALAAKGTAVAVARGETGEAGYLGAGAMAKFREKSEHGGGADRTHAGECKQAPGLGVECGMAGNVIGNEGLDLGDALFERGEVLVQIAQEGFVFGRFTVLLFAAGQFAELIAAADQGRQTLLARCRSGSGGRLELWADGGEGRGIDGVGLGEKAKAVGEFARTGGVKDAHGHGSRAKCGHHGAFVAAGGLADNVDGAAMGSDARQERGMAGSVIGEFKSRAAQVAGEAGFGDIETEIDEWWCHGYDGVVSCGGW